MKERLIYIDRLKGFTIFLVVLGHIIAENVENGINNKLYLFIYSFHMPLFFFLSGYIADKTTKIESIKNYFTYIKTKAITLLIPMIVWPLIAQYCFTSKLDFTGTTFFELVLKELRDPGLWFLRMLFVLLIVYSVFYLISNWVNKKKYFITDVIVLLCVLVPFVGVAFLLNLDTILLHLFYFIFFISGAFLSKYDFLKMIIDKNSIATAGVLLFVLFVGHYSTTIYAIDSTIMKLLKLFLSILAIIIFYNVAKKVVLPKWFDNQICFFGRKSLVIYVTHFSFILVFMKTMLLPEDISLFLLALITIPLSLLMIYFCIIISNIVSLFPALDFLLYGVRIIRKK